MKKGLNILLILCAVLVAISCSKTESYTDTSEDEKEAIERFVDDKGLEILGDFPANSIFKENQFVLLDNGVCLNIIGRGNDQRAVQYKTKMLYRCKMSHFIDSTIAAIKNYGPHSNGVSPTAFTYGDYSKNSSYDPSYYYVSEGMQELLKCVGSRTKMKTTVSFKRGTYNGQSND